ncbi:MAG: glycine cleavage system aminomethyltransferase GcvT [Sedimentisphaerales bacterium]|nr:glycine cleavage system aminomethyltransferase GcvT [Sedimentisphaerales bacterium]
MEAKKTPLYERHLAAGAKMVDFAGWLMPIQYAEGIVAEHLTTRKSCGLFDVSHMGRFIIRGGGALAFLQHVLTNDASALDIGQSQYTILANASGGAIDDAYLYRFVDHEYLLVVNASNKDKDWAHLEEQAGSFVDVVMEDVGSDLAMLAVQGPQSGAILEALLEKGSLPPDKRNCLSEVQIEGTKVLAGRTGYTGEPVCFELFLPAAIAVDLWDALTEKGAAPIGLGARDTLRLEAGLPLYGHEFGGDPEGREIPVFACPLAAFAVSFAEGKGDFLGKTALVRQARALDAIKKGDRSCGDILPRLFRQVVILGRGIARHGDPVLLDNRLVGHVTSGTMVPYWEFQQTPKGVVLGDSKGMRAVALALLDHRMDFGQAISIRVRGKDIEARIVHKNLENRKGPISYAVLPK